jgi:hypothetical protein
MNDQVGQRGIHLSLIIKFGQSIIRLMSAGEYLKTGAT